jgi:arylsulfatase A-like enzyme
MLELLEQRNQLDNTLVVVTSDNGMPFPRIKGQAYEWSNHLPLAVMWKRGIRHPGREIADFVSFIDFAPTFLEVARIDATASGMQPITGRSLGNIFQAEQGGQVEPERDHVLIGKERHDVGRPQDRGYPIRGIVKGSFLYLRNFAPDRWPAGNPETGYLNCDGSPTKTSILAMFRTGTNTAYWNLSFGKRPAEELYRVDEDPGCLHNLAAHPDLQEMKQALAAQMLDRLQQEGDPRVLGQGHEFDEYPVASPQASYYERFVRGEKVRAPWVSDSDYEPQPLDEQD